MRDYKSSGRNVTTNAPKSRRGKVRRDGAPLTVGSSRGVAV